MGRCLRWDCSAKNARPPQPNCHSWPELIRDRHLRLLARGQRPTRMYSVSVGCGSAIRDPSTSRTWRGMRPLAINRSTNGVTVIGFRGRNVAARITALARNARLEDRLASPPPGLPPIRTLDDIQGRARSLLGQEHNPERAVTRIDEPNPAHDHCGELRRPNTTLGRQAEVIRNASNRHSVRSPALGM